uniref:Uncharacterized protein n=1 Tax=Aegilops tauschii TaxID=37682 RepID=N1QTC4_AEGTA
MGELASTAAAALSSSLLLAAVSVKGGEERASAFYCEECRQEQMAMDETLHASARQHRKQAEAAMTASMVHRRRTIANLGAVARTPVAAS